MTGRLVLAFSLVIATLAFFCYAFRCERERERSPSAFVKIQNGQVVRINSEVLDRCEAAIAKAEHAQNIFERRRAYLESVIDDAHFAKAEREKFRAAMRAAETLPPRY